LLIPCSKELVGSNPTPRAIIGDSCELLGYKSKPYFKATLKKVSFVNPKKAAIICDDMVEQTRMNIKVYQERKNESPDLAFKLLPECKILQTNG
jgi:hypothetical protein